MKVVIIGFGSIARKHVFSLKKIEPEVKFFALRSSNNANNYTDVENIYSWAEIPSDIDFFIISNPTSEHAETILRCVEFKKPIFVEKPVLDKLDCSQLILEEINNSGILSYTAFNLRFHPAIMFLKQEFINGLPLEYNSYCGSYMPDWRPNLNYKDLYSSKKELGGGVHLDLIHEVDYCRYLLGNPKNSILYNSKKSNLEINSVDVAHYIFEFDDLSAFITLNYYRKDSKRTIDCVWEDKSWSIDLINNSIKDQKGNLIYSEPFDIMNTYVDQMKYFVSCISSDTMPENNIEEGIKTLKLALGE